MASRTVRVRLGVYLGATLEVDGRDWIKPAASADVIFESDDPSKMPTDKELKERWKWLWETQVMPQADVLMKGLLEKRRAYPIPPAKAEDGPDKPAGKGPLPTATTMSGGEPEGESYG